VDWPRSRTPAQFAETLEATFQLACEHYDGIAKSLDTLSLSELREKWLRQLLRLLDFKEVYQSKLKSQDGRETFDINFLVGMAKVRLRFIWSKAA